MTILFKAWGLDNSLNSYLDFPTWNGNGVQGLTAEPATQTAVGDRAQTIMYKNSKALVIKRYAGDPMAGSGHRSELTPDNYSHVMDWIGEGIGFATEAASTRQYRVQFMISNDQNLTWVVNGPSPFFLCFQLHQVPDDTPPDTAGLNPAFSICIRRSAEGQYRAAVIRNVDPTATTTVGNPAIHTLESCSWPFLFDTEYSVHVAVKWSYSTLGNMRVYLNRHPILIETGVPNCPNNSPARGGAGMYPKMGLYNSYDYNLAVIHRGIIVADGTNFAEMYPELPAAQAVPAERIARHTSSLAIFS